MPRIKPRQIKISLLLVCLSTTAVLFQNCGQAGDISLVSGQIPDVVTEDLASSTPSTDEEVTEPIPNKIHQVNITSHKNYVCEPFNGVGQTSSGINGLRGNIAFVGPTDSNDETFVRSLGAKDYWTNSSPLIHKSSTPLYFNQVNVIPMKFDQGFTTGDGKYLEDNSGNKLIEWFSVKYETQLVLSPEDAEGYYKLASVADDGLSVEAYIDGKWEQIVDNDGIHSPRFQCQNNQLHLTHSSKIKLRIHYFQGPRTVISNVLFFKYLGTSIPQMVSGCELNGSNDIYTDPWDGQVTGTSHYTSLINANWKIIPNKNFLLMDGDVNPCAKNSLTIVDANVDPYKIEGNKIVNDKAMSFQFLTSLESEAIVKLFDDSGNAPVMVDQSISASQMVATGKHKHIINLKNVAAGKNYRMEIIYRNISLNISSRAEFLIKPIPESDWQ
jgi:hypothetical protein